MGRVWVSFSTVFVVCAAALVVVSLVAVALFFVERDSLRPTVAARLDGLSPRELWQPAALPVRASHLSYAGLDRALSAALNDLQSGKIDRAMLSYTDAVARWQAHPAALAALARFYLILKDRGKLRRLLAELERIEPAYPALQLIRAEVELNAGHVERARQLLRPIQFAGAPVEGRARLLLAAIAMQENRRDEARALVRSVDASELELVDSRSAYDRLRSAVGDASVDAAP